MREPFWAIGVSDPSIKRVVDEKRAISRLSVKKKAACDGDDSHLMQETSTVCCLF